MAIVPELVLQIMRKLRAIEALRTAMKTLKGLRKLQKLFIYNYYGFTFTRSDQKTLDKKSSIVKDSSYTLTMPV